MGVALHQTISERLLMKGSTVSRRDFLKLAGAAAAAGPALRLGAAAAVPEALHTGQKTLKIAKWAHFLPEYDRWFEQVLARDWGQRHDTKVLVDHIPVEEVGARAAAEVSARAGHDLFIFPWPPAEYQEHVIDHTEIYQAVSFRHGNVDRLGHRSTFDPKTRRYFAFADSWVPAPLHYFADHWATVKMPLGPLHYGSLRSGGRRLRAQLGVPCGLALTPSLAGNVTLTGLLHAFGSGLLDANRDVIVNRGASTVTALQYVKALYEEAGAPEQLGWRPADHVRAMLARKTSCTVNAISLLRTAEKEDPEIARKIRLSPPLLGSAGIISVPHATNCSVVWSFAENREGAKQFLSEMIDSSKAIYDNSQGCNLPIFQKTLPDLIVRLEKDPRGDPPWKYKDLKDALHWTANLGFPDYANPVAAAAWNSFVVPRMFLSVVKGELRPEEAAKAAEDEVKRLADRWRQG
jgi:multiple sugar transport system substrate-binding protein